MWVHNPLCACIIFHLIFLRKTPSENSLILSEICIFFSIHRSFETLIWHAKDRDQSLKLITLLYCKYGWNNVQYTGNCICHSVIGILESIKSRVISSGDVACSGHIYFRVLYFRCYRLLTAFANVNTKMLVHDQGNFSFVTKSRNGAFERHFTTLSFTEFDSSMNIFHNLRRKLLNYKH